MRRPILFIISLIILLFGGCTQSSDWSCQGNCDTGQGTKKWPDGGYETGRWHGGELNGKGKQYFGSTSKFAGDSYEGNFYNGFYDGYGIYIGNELDFIHRGYWKHGKPDGYSESVFGSHAANPGYGYIR